MSTDAKVAIVAALEREVWPLVKNWPVSRREYDRRWFRFYQKDGTVLVCGGMGAEAARRAAEAIISLYHPELVISAGFAGALDPSLQAGQTLTPRQVIDASDGSRTDSGSGEGVLISFATVADTEQKAKLAEAYGGHAVDMEAAAVARSAEAHGVKFLACKVISDASNSSLPPIARFIGDDGRFRAVQFLAYVALRPWLWRSVMRLARNSSLAAGKLCEALTAVQEAKVADSERQGVY